PSTRYPPTGDIAAPAIDASERTSSIASTSRSIASTVSRVLVSGVPLGYPSWTKTSPLSCAGSNSKPTTPSGINASAATSETIAIVATAGPWLNPHGNAWSAYHERRRSKPRANGAVNLMNLPLESSAQLPASAGVTVKETSNEASVATTTTTANSLR